LECCSIVQNNIDELRLTKVKQTSFIVAKRRRCTLAMDIFSNRSLNEIVIIENMFMAGLSVTVEGAVLAVDNSIMLDITSNACFAL